jgi:hypothetical protein
MATSCTIKADLSEANLAGNGPARWSAPAITGEPTVESLRARAEHAAEWLAGLKREGKRLSLVCLDVEAASCLWLRSPSAEAPVLNATLRQATQDWGGALAGGSVQRMIDAESPEKAGRPSLLDTVRRPIGKPKPAAGTAAGCPVLSLPSALARLWLDELDARGVRAERVVTLWHAMALAWGLPANPSDVTAVILLEPGTRAVWSWCRGADLIVGGSVMEEPPAEAEDTASANARRLAGRLALDWLTWSAHLGLTPLRIVLVGDGVEALRPPLAERFPTTSISAESARDPVMNTVIKASAATKPEQDAPSPRRCLVSLTQRPTRALRTQYRWAAAALVCLAAALGLLSFRMARAGGEVRTKQVEVDAESRGLVQRLNDPKLAEAPNILKSLESEYAKLRNLQPPKPPPSPKPMRAEIERLVGVLAKREGIRMVQLSLDMRAPSSMQLTVPDRRTGEDIRVALQKDDPALDWREGGSLGTDQSIRLTGTWTR